MAYESLIHWSPTIYLYATTTLSAVWQNPKPFLGGSMWPLSLQTHRHTRAPLRKTFKAARGWEPDFVPVRFRVSQREMGACKRSPGRGLPGPRERSAGCCFFSFIRCVFHLSNDLTRLEETVDRSRGLYISHQVLCSKGVYLVLRAFD